MRKSIIDQQVLSEIAYHEASHLVVSRFYFKRNLTDKEPVRIRVSKLVNNSEIYFARTKGDAVSDHDYYRLDEYKVKSYIIQLLSGYVSYLIFIDEVDDWIGYSNEKEIIYYTLDSVRSSNCVSDFRKVRPIIIDFFGGKDSYVEKLNEFIEATKELLQNDDIQEAINFCHDRLLENVECFIEDDDMKNLIAKVDNLIK